MLKPTTLFFDINETMLDLSPMAAPIGAALGGRADLAPLWFTTLLHYSLVDTMTGNYRPFGEIGVAVLQMLAQREGITLSQADAKAAIMDRFLTLPAHADVVPALQSLKDAGFRIVALANSAAGAIERQFAFAGLTPFFERVISTEEVSAFKPDPRTYAHGLDVTGTAPRNAMMIACHAWDLAGAKQAGMQTAFIQRQGQTLYPNTARPDLVLPDFTELARVLTA